MEAAAAEAEPTPVGEQSPPNMHYYVPGQSQAEEEDGWGEEVGFTENNESTDSSDRFLVLPQQDLLVYDALSAIGEPQIDYSQSYILTSDKYVVSLEAKVARK